MLACLLACLLACVRARMHTSLKKCKFERKYIILTNLKLKKNIKSKIFQKTFILKFFFSFKKNPNYKNCEISLKSKGSKGRGDLHPCCYDLEWTEITASGDRIPNLILLHFQIISNNSKGMWNVGGKLYLPSSGFKNSYQKQVWITLMWGDIVCHQHFTFLCFYLKLFESVIVREWVFGLPLLLFQFIRDHNSKGTGLPSLLEPLGFGNISQFL